MSASCKLPSTERTPRKIQAGSDRGHDDPDEKVRHSPADIGNRAERGLGQRVDAEEELLQRGSGQLAGHGHRHYSIRSARGWCRAGEYWISGLGVSALEWALLPPARTTSWSWAGRPPIGLPEL